MVYSALSAAAASRLSSRGASLLLALVFLLMLAMIAAMVMQSSIMQLHMAGNDQFQQEALHAAQGIADEVSQQPGNFVLEGAVGDINCPLGAEPPGCHRYQLQLPDTAQSLRGMSVDLRVIRQEPLLWYGFPLREGEDIVSSSTSFDAAVFEIDVTLSGQVAGAAATRVVQGIALRVPAFR